MMYRPLVVVLWLAAAGCTDVIIPGDRARASPTTADPAPTTTARIEFRVLSNATAVRVRFSNAADGLTQLTTTTPYLSTITTSADSMFLSIEATPLSYSALVTFPFLTVQIFANGVLFREANSNEFLLNTIAVSGTWRRP